MFFTRIFKGKQVSGSGFTGMKHAIPHMPEKMQPDRYGQWLNGSESRS
jgi:hypothetical protein